MNAVPDAARSPFRKALYLAVGRVLPGALFLYFGVFNIQLLHTELLLSLHREPTVGTFALLMNRVMSILFSSGVALIYVFRPRAQRTTYRPWPVFLAMYASLVLITLRPLGLFIAVGPFGPLNPLQITASNILIGLGIGFSFYSVMYLRWNFSVVPEARELTLEGPYRWVRHPVYLGEIVSGFGLVLALPSLYSAVVFASFVGAQWWRSMYEEQILTDEFPQYAAYSARVKRLIPGLL